MLSAIALCAAGFAPAGFAPAGRICGVAPRAAVSRATLSAVAMALPELYVYDHCPFCVRVRVAFGLKGIKHKLVFLGNDDVETPTALVGKKVHPRLLLDAKPSENGPNRRHGPTLPPHCRPAVSSANSGRSDLG